MFEKQLGTNCNGKDFWHGLQPKLLPAASKVDIDKALALWAVVAVAATAANA